MAKVVSATEDLLKPAYRLEGHPDVWHDWRRFASLTYYLTRRSLSARYRGSIWGFVWSIINPLMMMGVYTFVFRYVFRSTIPGLPYAVYFLTGLLIWNCFRTASFNAATSIVDHMPLVKRLYFPRVVLPLSMICSNLVNYLTTIPILLIFNMVLGVIPSSTIIFFPVVLILLLCLTTGVGLLAAGIQSFFRDLLQLLDVLFTIWFFATPILYPISFLHQSLTPQLLNLYTLNPMVGITLLTYAVFLGQPVSIDAVIISACGSIGLLVLGLRCFSRLSLRFADI
jgi:ABC-type polysaccharide/polyol phosphate export permease